MLISKRVPLLLIYRYSTSGISTLEARRIMQIPDGTAYPSPLYTEDHLKK